MVTVAEEVEEYYILIKPPVDLNCGFIIIVEDFAVVYDTELDYANE